MLQESFILGAKIPKVKKLPAKFSNPPKTKNTPTFRLKNKKHSHATKIQTLLHPTLRFKKRKEKNKNKN